MHLLDNLKTKLSPARDRVAHLAQKHEGKIQHGLDKAAHTVDRKTKGKYSDRIQSGTGRAKHAMDRLAHHDGDHTPPSPGGSTTPPAPGGGTAPPPPPAS
ncbi:MULTISPECIES: antitoxin [Streptomyces]|uniref:Antitoxin n=1 Tax=Streptomyces caniscabiei TaxID=2746961 RepID=A0ABU4MMT9_9ACTN|nr:MULTISPECIES: antitoxin [Streptomyces]MBE4734100.1 antitoxin [Streptomyces caniscabiei]MBE4759292.1 antitoxin [Streptomyces caniscabiei]MBE4773357.1 antitoxin [Streptomyces caniscabiei]MBE4783744.1 antitoxin [Streptomyces caniscabiei]MBE4793048.1 antitoxin [Streptomyces caniscabiei]